MPLLEAEMENYVGLTWTFLLNLIKSLGTTLQFINITKKVLRSFEDYIFIKKMHSYSCILRLSKFPGAIQRISLTLPTIDPTLYSPHARMIAQRTSSMEWFIQI